MTIRTTLATILCAAAVSSVSATELTIAKPATEQSALTTYTAPLEAMFGVIEQINGHLASAQDEETAEAAGEAIQELLPSLDAAAVAFSNLPAPSPEVQAQLDTWFAEREHIMESMVKEVTRLQNEDPAFFGSQTLVVAIVYIGGILGGGQ